jgi:protoheme IX farnesyltransferase
MWSTFNNYLQLSRIRISLFAALSAVAGYVISASEIQIKIIPVFTGVMLLACGASALNQFQERVTDALMPRTKSRPLPAGKISPGRVLRFSLILASVGFIFLSAGCSLRSALIGLFALSWYNGVYTLLKKKTAFAVIPGALTGALPPAIGWVAAGGLMTDPRLLAISAFVAIWQVPHFWLFLLERGNEYREAGLPSITSVLGRRQIARIIFQWIAATALCGPALCMFGLAESPVIRYSLVTASVWLIFEGICFVRNSRVPMSVFGRLNVYIAVVMTLLASEKITILLTYLHGSI